MQSVHCPSCGHEFFPTFFEITGSADQDDGYIVYLTLWAGIDDMGLNDYVRIPKTEEVLVGTGKNQRYETRDVVLTPERIRAECVRKLNEYAKGKRSAPTKETDLSAALKGLKGVSAVAVPTDE